MFIQNPVKNHPRWSFLQKYSQRLKVVEGALSGLKAVIHEKKLLKDDVFKAAGM